MDKEKVIIIGGGVGPMAGVQLHKMIIENTCTTGRDQDHFQVWHFSRSNTISDRTEFLNGITDSNPADGMAATFKLANTALDIEGKEAIAGITCNTFHADKIFNRFLHLLDEHKIKIKMLHMIEETGMYLQAKIEQGKTIGILSTSGTRRTNIYTKLVESNGYKALQIDSGMQNEIHETIYNKNWGIKAISPVTEHAKKRMETYAQILINSGAEAIILGCTEIPLALPNKKIYGIPLINPVLVLARALIRESNVKKLKALN